MDPFVSIHLLEINRNSGIYWNIDVFSLVKRMFGEQQISALADYIRAALMKKFNQRQVG